MGLEELIKLILTSGVAPLCLGILYGGFKGWWVYGRDYNKLEREKDEWKKAALDGLYTAKRLSSHVVEGGSDVPAGE